MTSEYSPRGPPRSGAWGDGPGSATLLAVIADVLALVLVCAMALLGWYRGTLVQAVTVGVALLLIVFFDAWYPPLDLPLANLAMALAEYPYLRKLVAFLGAYIGSMTVVAIIELATRGSRGETVNRSGGVVIGAIKGLVYAVALAWLVETVTLWDKPPHEPTPSWIRESTLMAAVRPWNPVRVYALREAMERKLAKSEQAQREADAKAEADAERQAAGDPLDEAAAAATPDGGAKSSAKRPEPDFAALDEVHTSDKTRALWRMSPMRALMDETASLSEWQGRGYGELVRDPEVRAVLRDADIADLLMGE